MALDEVTDKEVDELSIKFPRLLTTDETTRLLDYVTSMEPYVAEYVVQQEVTSGRLKIRSDGKREWVRNTKPAGIYGSISLIDQPDLSVLFDCEMETTDEVRFKNITFGMPSEHYPKGELRRAKKDIIDGVRSLAKKYF